MIFHARLFSLELFIHWIECGILIIYGFGRSGVVVLYV